MTHIAGLAVTIGPFIRQRCAWCGEVIQDDDTRRMASLDGSGPASFACGALVSVNKSSGCTHFSLVAGNELPADSCFDIEQQWAQAIEGILPPFPRPAQGEGAGGEGEPTKEPQP